MYVHRRGPYAEAELKFSVRWKQVQSERMHGYGHDGGGGGGSDTHARSQAEICLENFKHVSNLKSFVTSSLYIFDVRMKEWMLCCVCMRQKG